MHFPEFRYMRWAKTHSGVHRYDLTLSAAPGRPLDPVEHPELPRQTPTGDGDRVNEGLIAERYGVPAGHVLFVPGSTLGNYLLASVLVRPGDRVLVEEPAYENLPGLVRVLGATPVPLARRADLGYLPDPAEIEAAFRSGILLLILTDLHNPTGTPMPADLLREIAGIARTHGARILMDEVYRDFLPGAPGTAYQIDPKVIVVASSLTKVYGMGAMRAGWILCPPDLRSEAACLLDYLTVLPPAPVAYAAEQVLREIAIRRDAARDYVARGGAVFNRFLAAREDVRCRQHQAGVVAFPAFRGIADTAKLVAWLRNEHSVAVVPGAFFGDRTRIRLAAGAAPEVLEPALEILARAVDRFSERP
jgi:aspartate/methionine/tyrosine aminotransferase